VRERASELEALPVQHLLKKKSGSHVLLNSSLLRSYGTEIRSDLKREKSKTGRRGCRHNKGKSYEIIDRIESGNCRDGRLCRADNRRHGPGGIGIPISILLLVFLLRGRT
jgi:hypothetical protein